MRLLVYGGNQYGERRRIGAWPDDVSTDVLQDNYGYSERNSAFGVGLLDSDPFLIFRRVQAHNQRSYPLTVLLDPGEAMWAEFEWNGAHLLSILFGEPGSPGNNLLREPETFHSEAHLATLFESVRQNILQTPKESFGGSNLFQQFWSGALLASSPIVVGVDERLTGLVARPSIKDLIPLLQSVPPALRCGMGWLVGGNLSHATAFGVHVILDDTRNETADSKELSAFSQLRDQGAKLTAALETVVNLKSPEGEKASTEFLNQPLFVWQKESGFSLQRIFKSLLLLGELIAAQGESVIHRAEESDRRFEKVIKGVEEGTPLAEHIRQIAYALLQGTRNLTVQETKFVLNDLNDRRKAPRKEKEFRNRLNLEAAFDHFYKNRIYPSEARGAIPENIQMKVWEELLASEIETKDLPEILKKEVQGAKVDHEDLKKLVEIAVRRSASAPGGLRLWLPYLSGDLGEAIAECLQAESRGALENVTDNSLTDYLLLGNDPGGASLNAPQIECVDQLIAFLIRVMENKSESALRRRAQEWLSSLARTNLRGSVRLEDKRRIAGLLPDDWASFRLLSNCFQQGGLGGHGPKLRKLEETEHAFLVQELREFASQYRNGPNAEIPDLDRLRSILGPAHLESIIDALYAFVPDLNQSNAPEWLYGWQRIQHDAEEMDASLREKSGRKFRSELTRFCVTTNLPFPKKLTLSSFGRNELHDLFGQLLHEGKIEDDENRRTRFVELIESSKDELAVKELFQFLYSEIINNKDLRARWLRRYASDQATFDLFKRHLRESESKALDRWRSEWIAGQAEELRQRIGSALSGESALANLLQTLKDEKVRFEQLEKGLFLKNLSGAVGDVVNEESKRRAFLSLHVENQALLKFIDKNLGPKNQSELKQILTNEKRRAEIDSIEKYLYGGSWEDDQNFRKNLQELLAKAQPDEAEIIEGAVINALSDNTFQQNLFARFATKTRSAGPQSMLKVEESKVTNLLFENLSFETQVSFFDHLFNFYRDIRIDDHPVAHFAHDTCKKIRLKGKTHEFEPSALQKAILSFMTVKQENSKLVKLRVALWMWGGGKTKKIDELLRNYARDNRSSADIEAENEESTKKGGILHMISRKFKSLVSDDQECDQLDDEGKER